MAISHDEDGFPADIFLSARYGYPKSMITIHEGDGYPAEIVIS